MRKYAREMAFSMVYAFLVSGEREEKLFERDNEETRRAKKLLVDGLRVEFMQDLGSQLKVSDAVWLSESVVEGHDPVIDRNAFLLATGLTEEALDGYIAKKTKLHLEHMRGFLPIDMFEGEKIDEIDKDFIEKIYYAVVDNADAYADKLSSFAKKYRIERIYRVDKALIFSAMAELESVDTPTAVVVNEIVNLARKFSTEKSMGFINGILGRYVDEMEKAGTEGSDKEVFNETAKEKVRAEIKPDSCKILESETANEKLLYEEARCESDEDESDEDLIDKAMKSTDWETVGF